MHQEIDAYGWIVIGGMAVYVGVIFRVDLWLWEKGVRWHSDGDMDYANVFDPNAQALVQRHEDKVKQKQADDKDKE